jgi:hypothetical protein
MAQWQDPGKYRGGDGSSPHDRTERKKTGDKLSPPLFLNPPRRKRLRKKSASNARAIKPGVLLSTVYGGAGQRR